MKEPIALTFGEPTSAPSASHTPGPWYAAWAADNQKTGIGHWVIWPRDPNAVSCILKRCKQNSPRDAANARLVAAAPELLEALKIIAKNANAMAVDPMQANRGLWAACRVDALAAIAKASQTDGMKAKP